MPNAPGRLCAIERCPNKATKRGLCDEHRAKLDAKRYKQRKEEVDFYHSKKWKDDRKEQLRKFPFCQKILEDGKPCNSIDRCQVDHKIPRRKGGKDDPSNYQTLCHGHHSEKTLSENR